MPCGPLAAQATTPHGTSRIRPDGRGGGPDVLRYRALHARLVHALRPTTGRILDAGCGTGGFLAALATQRPDLTRIGLEWNPTAALRAAAKSGAAIARGSVNTLPFAADAFDAAVSADVLCHAAVDPPAALSGAPPCAASRRPPDPQPAWPISGCCPPTTARSTMPAASLPHHRRPATPGRLPARPRRLLEQPPAPADDRPAQAAHPWQFRVRRRPVSAMARCLHCTPPRILNATSPSPFPSAARCWQ